MTIEFIEKIESSYLNLLKKKRIMTSQNTHDNISEKFQFIF